MENKKKMTREDFDTTLRGRLNLIKSTMNSKAQEYRRNDNPFHNFEEGAILINGNREDVLKGFMLKHEVSINDMLTDWRAGISPNRETVVEKFGDVINYFILLEAMMLDNVEQSRKLPF